MRSSSALCALLAAGWLAVACGNGGGVGDGVIDDSMAPGGASSGGSKSNRAGAPSSNAGYSAAGAPSSAGTSGMPGVGGGAGMSGSAGISGSAGAGAGAGAGGSSGSTGMGGNPGGGTSGSSAGGASAGAAGAVSLTCGNGTIENGEQCDDGMSGGGASTGGSAAVFGQQCSNTCTKISTKACVDCENAGLCSESVNNCLGVDVSFDAAQQTQCFAVISCIQKSNCLDGDTGSLGKCYCGALDTGPCGAAPFTGAGSPSGPCVAQIKAGFPTYTSNQQVLGGLTATDFPSGAAMKRLNCQKTADVAACLGPCGFTSGGPAFP